MSQFRFDPQPVGPFLYKGSGSMNYPKGEMRYVWDGRGTVGRSAECRITETEILLRPAKLTRAILGWPEVVLALSDLRGYEMTTGRFRFRSENELMDGACFRPIGESKALLASVLERLGVQRLDTSATEHGAFEVGTIWNQIRWGGRKRQRHWKRES